MPANPRSLRITDLYGRRLKAVEARVKNTARAAWGFQQGDFDAAYEQWLPLASIAVTEGQRENLRLTAGYLSAYLTSETGRFTRPPAIDPAPWVGSSQNGRPFRDAYRDTVVDAKVAISEGKTVEEASNIALKTALTMVSLDTYEAARGPFHEVLPSISAVIGFRRVSNGETCAACLGLEDGTVLPSEDTFEIHPGCDCVGEPVIGDLPERVSRPTGTEKFRELPPEIQNESIGIKAAEAVRNGDVTLSELVQTYRTETGPDFITQRPLSDAI
jgi:hypothetical protein